MCSQGPIYNPDSFTISRTYTLNGWGHLGVRIYAQDAAAVALVIADVDMLFTTEVLKDTWPKTRFEVVTS